MLSVRNMLTESQQKQQPMEPNVNTTTRTPVTFNEQLHEKKPSVLNISSLLCSGGIPELPIQLPKPAHFHQLPPPPPPLLLQQQQSQQPQAYHYHSSIQQQPQREKSIELEGHEEDAYVQKLWARQTRLNQPSFHQQQSMPHSYYLLNKHQRRSSRQHQIESQKIEQELLHDRRKSSSSSSSTTSSLIYSLSTAKSKTKHYSLANKEEEDEEEELPLKAKRRRASSKQLDVLNKVFERTFFPSTQLRAELGRQLGMSPRTVQIWFQNRRQAIRTKERTGSVTSNSSRENSISLE